VYGEVGSRSYAQKFTGYPRSILSYRREAGAVAGQKPVALLEYLIRTYTRRGELVLDNAMGTGSTGVAAVNTGRRFIGMELDPDRFRLAAARIRAAEVLMEGAA
jgi:site-specific DNA-methyltransferase (adenine-specific)